MPVEISDEAAAAAVAVFVVGVVSAAAMLVASMHRCWSDATVLSYRRCCWRSVSRWRAQWELGQAEGQVKTPF